MVNNTNIMEPMEMILDEAGMRLEVEMEDEMSVVGGVATIACLHCKEVFQEKRRLQRHYRENHATNQRLAKGSERRKYARYLCDLCPKHFADNWTWKHHMRTVHLAVREHACQLCTKAFLSNKDLKRHVDGVHLKKKIVYPGQKQKVKPRKKYVDIEQDPSLRPEAIEPPLVSLENQAMAHQPAVALCQGAHDSNFERPDSLRSTTVKELDSLRSTTVKELDSLRSTTAKELDPSRDISDLLIKQAQSGSVIADLLSTISKLPASNLAQSINESTSIDRNAQSAARQQTQGKTVDKNRLDNRISPPTKNELNNENKTEGEEKGERKRIKSQRLLDLGLFRGRVSGSSRLSIKVPPVSVPVLGLPVPISRLSLPLDKISQGDVRRLALDEIKRSNLEDIVNQIKVSDSAKPRDSAAFHPATEESPVQASDEVFTKITPAMLKGNTSPTKALFESSLERTNNSNSSNNEREALAEDLPPWKNDSQIEYPIMNNNINGTSGEGNPRLSAGHRSEPGLSGFHGTVPGNTNSMEQNEVNEFVHQSDKEATPSELNLGIEDAPVFQLENLENLQLVVPELGEPQIVIPETGIRLKISAKSEFRNFPAESESQVLTIVPDSGGGGGGSAGEGFKTDGGLESAMFYISPFQDHQTLPSFNMECTDLHSIPPPKPTSPNRKAKLVNNSLFRGHSISLESFHQLSSSNPSAMLGEISELVADNENPPKGTFENLPADNFDNLPKNNFENLPKSNVENLGNEPEEMESGVIYQDDKDDVPDDRITEYELPVIMNTEKVENQISNIITQDKLARLIDTASGKVDLSKASTCNICDRRFISDEFLERHKFEFHPMETTKFMLEELEQGFIKQHFPIIETAEIEPGGQLCSDQQEESLTNPLSLPICQDIEISQQEEAVQYTCTVCNQEFKQKQLLTKHSKLVHKVKLKYQCSQCDKCYSSEQSLKQHTSSVHDRITSVCYICLKPVIDITRHIRLQHKNTERKYSCDICEKPFHTQFAMSRHKDYVHHNLRPFPCQLCEKTFASKRDMERHTKSLHFRMKSEERREWTCPLCNINFRQKAQYNQHKMDAHANSSQLEILAFLSAELDQKKEKQTAREISC